VTAGLLAVLSSATGAAAQTGDLPPAGYGTLRQDQVAVRLVTSTLAVRALPLDERVIRLLAPDAYRSLHELVASRSAEISSAASYSRADSVTLFMVTFYGLQPQTQFSPDQVYITSLNQEFRPIGVVALTPGFGESRVDQRQQAVAIFLFEPGIDVLQPFVVAYGAQQSEAWTASLRQLDAERARVIARARQAAAAEPPE
jgi:hypothetical protein